MNKSLKGNILYFPVILIIKFIKDTGKSGTLSIYLKDKDRGEIYFKKGSVISALYRDFKGDRALNSLLKFNGLFTYSEDSLPEKLPSGNITEKFLNENLSLWEKLNSLSQNIPLNELEFFIVPYEKAKTDEKIVFSRNTWVLLSHVNSSPFFFEMIDNTDMSELESGKILLDLYEKGYINYRRRSYSEVSTGKPVLKGYMFDFKFKDVLSLLNKASLYGNLEMISDNRKLNLYIEDRYIYDAGGEHWSGEMAIGEGLSYYEGEFSFYRNIKKDRGRAILSCEEILRKNSGKLKELAQKIEIFRHPAIKIKLNRQIDRINKKEFTFTPQDRQILRKIDGKKTINDLIQELDIESSDFIDKLYKFYKSKLLIPLEESIEETASQKLSVIEEEGEDILILLHQESVIEDIEILKNSILSSYEEEDLSCFLPSEEKIIEGFSSVADKEEDDDILSLLHQESIIEDREKLKHDILYGEEEEDIFI